MKEKIEISRVIKEVFLPIAIYYLVNTVLLMGMISFAGIQGNQGDMHISLVLTMMKIVAMMLAGVSVIPFYQKESLRWKTEIKTRFDDIKAADITCVIAMGVVLAVVLNYLFSISGFIENSSTYQQVAKIQFSLDLVPAILFYGIVSPCMEELVFRGIVYRTLERNISGVPAMVGSALLFGAFHGNVVQMLYGTLMGCVMAWIYKRYGRIIMPILFHAVANITVYLCSYFF